MEDYAAPFFGEKVHLLFFNETSFADFNLHEVLIYLIYFEKIKLHKPLLFFTFFYFLL